MVGGTAMTGPMGHPHLWYKFLQLLAEDKDPDKMIDFYSTHDYNKDINRLSAFYKMHHEWIKELNLPDVPIFFDEYGTVGATGIWTDSLENAAGVLSGMILGSRLEGMYIFPWCTFHNPDLQMSYTQFLRLDDGSYAPTPNGNAITLLHMLEENELEMEGDHKNSVIAAGNGSRTTVLVTNPTDKPMAVDITLTELSQERVLVTEYLVDTSNNNRLTGPECSELRLTNRWNEKTGNNDKSINIRTVLDKYGFCLWIIEPHELSRP